MSRPTTKRRKSKQTSAAPSKPSAYKANQDRKSARTGRLFAAAAALVVLAGGGWMALDFTKKLAEADLSVIGDGTPVIVQVYDQACVDCTLLQREVRAALDDLPPDAVLYRLANLQTREGAAFAAAARLSYASLGLYDADGTMVHAVRGVTPADELETLFRDLFEIEPGS